MKTYLKIIIGGLFFTAGVSSLAGVNKCIDNKGQVTYSQNKCPVTTKASQIHIVDNAIGDSTIDRRIAETRRQEELRTTREREASLKKAAKEQEKKKKDKDDEDDEDNSNYSMPIPPKHQHPTVITSCNRGGCWDDQGNRYNNRAGNRVINTTTGETCQKRGARINCN